MRVASSMTCTTTGQVLRHPDRPLAVERGSWRRTPRCRAAPWRRAQPAVRADSTSAEYSGLPSYVGRLADVRGELLRRSRVAASLSPPSQHRGARGRAARARWTRLSSTGQLLGAVGGHERRRGCRRSRSRGPRATRRWPRRGRGSSRRASSARCRATSAVSAAKPTSTRSALRAPSSARMSGLRTSAIARGASSFLSLLAAAVAGRKSATAADMTTTSAASKRASTASRICERRRARARPRTPNGSGSVRRAGHERDVARRGAPPPRRSRSRSCPRSGCR